MSKKSVYRNIYLGAWKVYQTHGSQIFAEVGNRKEAVLGLGEWHVISGRTATVKVYCPRWYHGEWLTYDEAKQLAIDYMTGKYTRINVDLRT